MYNEIPQNNFRIIAELDKNMFIIPVHLLQIDFIAKQSFSIFQSVLLTKLFSLKKHIN